MIQVLLKLSRTNKQVLMIFFDTIALISILYGSFWIRLGEFYYPSSNLSLLIAIYASPILALPIFIGLGLYREVIRYVGFQALWRIFQAASSYAALWGLIVFMARIESIPRSVILINWLYLFL